jgi:RNA polymerase sigma-70 factor (ECF subfamily)
MVAQSTKYFKRSLPLDEITRARAIRYLRSRRLAVTQEDAEDAVQDAALAALTTHSPFRGDSQFSSWFIRVAVNAALMSRRRPYIRSRNRFLPMEAAEWVPKPDGHRRDCLLRERIIRAIAQLPTVKRCAFLRHCVLGETLEEIAKSEKISRSAAKARLYRARLKLRCILTEDHANSSTSFSSAS